MKLTEFQRSILRNAAARLDGRIGSYGIREQSWT
jgi:hypothetical protein